MKLKQIGNSRGLVVPKHIYRDMDNPVLVLHNDIEVGAFCYYIIDSKDAEKFQNAFKNRKNTVQSVRTEEEPQNQDYEQKPEGADIEI